MKVVDKNNLTDMDLDLRVRERHLASGALDQSTIENYLAALTDLEGQYEPLPYEQPALGRSQGDGM